MERYKGGGQSSKVKLSFPAANYTPSGLMSHSEKELRKEYTRLRDIAQKRLKRIRNSRFADSDVLAYNEGRYIPLKAVTSKTELTHLLTDLNKFINATRGTLSGLKDVEKRTIESLHESGYNFVNKDNIKDFGNYMEWVRSFYKSSQLDSDRIAKAHKLFTEDWNLPIESLQKEFTWFLDQISPPPGNVSAYRKALDPKQLEGKDPKRVKSVLQDAMNRKIPVSVLKREFDHYYSGERVSAEEYAKAFTPPKKRRK